MPEKCKIKGRSQIGSLNAHAKLTEAQVLEARKQWRPRHPEYGMHIMAEALGVKRQTLWAAIRRVSWRHI